MEFIQFAPSDTLKPYIRHYYLFQSNLEGEFEDTVFPSGDMEIIFNLGRGIWEINVNGVFRKNPEIELWGQITKPLTIRSLGKQVMLGVKFFTHSVPLFFDEGIGDLNNQVYDLYDLLGNPIKTLQSKLLEVSKTGVRIDLIEQFLVRRLIERAKKADRIDKVGGMLDSIARTSVDHTILADHTIGFVASQHGITPRYLHKLIQQYTGLSPKEFTRINRFQSSLRLIAGRNQPLTAIAYHCGYFDQSHFIRDFKSFTGVTPSAYIDTASPVNQLL